MLCGLRVCVCAESLICPSLLFNTCVCVCACVCRKAYVLPQPHHLGCTPPHSSILSKPRPHRTKFSRVAWLPTESAFISDWLEKNPPTLHLARGQLEYDWRKCVRDGGAVLQVAHRSNIKVRGRAKVMLLRKEHGAGEGLAAHPASKTQ